MALTNEVNIYTVECNSWYLKARYFLSWFPIPSGYKTRSTISRFEDQQTEYLSMKNVFL